MGLRGSKSPERGDGEENTSIKWPDRPHLDKLNNPQEGARVHLRRSRKGLGRKLLRSKEGRSVIPRSLIRKPCSSEERNPRVTS